MDTTANLPDITTAMALRCQYRLRRVVVIYQDADGQWGSVVDCRSEDRPGLVQEAVAAMGRISRKYHHDEGND